MFDGKNKNFDLFVNLFHAMPKMQPEMNEAMKKNQFYAHMRQEA